MAFERLKRCDKFGARLQLQAGGEAQYTTTGGTLISIVFRVIMLSFLIIQFQQVIEFEDPHIVNYDMYTDRSSEEPLALSDYSMHLKWFFLDPTGNPVPLPPRIGYFIIENTRYGFDWKTITYYKNNTEVEIREIDFTKEYYPDGGDWFNGKPVKGVYTYADDVDV